MGEGKDQRSRQKRSRRRSEGRGWRERRQNGKEEKDRERGKGREEVRGRRKYNICQCLIFGSTIVYVFINKCTYTEGLSKHISCIVLCNKIV